MGAFKENLEEQHARRQYRKESRWVRRFAFFTFSFVVCFIVLGNGDTPSFAYFVNAPGLLSSSLLFYIVGFFVLLGAGVFFWGMPAFINSRLPEKRRWYGRDRELNAFFYQGMTEEDGLPRGRGWTFLSHKKVTVDNMFDFDPRSHQYDSHGTHRIMGWFRDSTLENLERLSSSKSPKNKKKRESATLAINEYWGKYGKEKPSSSRVSKYRDVMSIIEGLLQEYNSIKKSGASSPLIVKVDAKTRRIKSFTVDEKIMMFKNSEVYFSMRATIGTVRGLSALFSAFLHNQLKGGGKVLRQFSALKDDDEQIRFFEDLFKLVIFRRLVANYGNIPSGWFVVRIDNYTVRAVLSEIDRPVSPKITSTNNGESDRFSSDVEAAQFMQIYWMFMMAPDIAPIIEAIDWSFNTIKDLNEITAREYAKSEEGRG